MLNYDFPLNERVRTLLRLEDLFERMHIFVRRDTSVDHHVALITLFEVMEVATRADLKSDLLQELERQKHLLENLRSNPDIREDVLDQVLTEIEHTMRRLLESVGKFAQHLRDNEWLMSIKQRAGLPGGLAEFDIPSYHHWLHRPTEQRRQDIERWVAPLLPIRDGLTIVLRLLRDSGKAFHFVAHNGVFQQMAGGKLVQMLRIQIDESLPCVPELSANKYAINVRFTSQHGLERPKLCELDLPFDLVFCNL